MLGSSQYAAAVSARISSGQVPGNREMVASRSRVRWLLILLELVASSFIDEVLLARARCKLGGPLSWPAPLAGRFDAMLQLPGLGLDRPAPAV